MQDDERSTELGHERLLGAGSVAALWEFRHHHSAPHRDPGEEMFSGPVMIFTTGGRWGYRISGAAVCADASTIVIGDERRPYRARHDTSVPTDVALAVCVDRASLDGCRDGAWDALAGAGWAPATLGTAAIRSALLREATERATGFALAIDGLALSLVAELARARELGPAQGAPIRADLRERLAHAKRFLDGHLAEDVDLQTLAREVSLSPFYLARLFRTEFGIAPHAYLVRARLERAAELLRGSSLSVTQIAGRVGSRSPSHLASRFRRHFGVSPTAYRALASRKTSR